MVIFGLKKSPAGISTKNGIDLEKEGCPLLAVKKENEDIIGHSIIPGNR